MKCLNTAWVIVLLCFACWGCAENKPAALTSDPQSAKWSDYHPRQAADIIGVSHVIGRYYFTQKDFLNEGADEILKMGSRVIKLWFYNAQEDPPLYYPYNSDWPQAKTLVEGAQIPYWKAVFDKPFTTYLLYHQSMGTEGYYFAKGITDQQAAEDERQTYELAKYFLTAYKGTGKTFILASSEIDWHLQDEPIGPNQPIPAERFGYLIKWLNARQAGVEKARREAGMDGVRVFHAVEVVNVMKALRQGARTVVNEVLPNIDIDLVGYSAYDSTVYDGVRPRKDLLDALNYISSCAKPSKFFGKKQVFIAEWGVPENEFSQEDVKKLTHQVVETGLEWGCPYIVHWQLYCNEPIKAYRVPYRIFKDNPCWDAQKFRGFWLIRPDGSKNYIYHFLKELCLTNRTPEYRPAANARFSCRPLSEIIGSTHTRPNYYFGRQDCLNEGADRLLQMGTKVVKVWFYMGKKETPDAMYRWNSDWPKVHSLVEGAQAEYWKKFFQKPFKTFILNTMEMVPMDDYYWLDAFTEQQEQEVERQIYELARYFLKTYRGTGKTFIIANHETDWHLERDWGNWEATAPDYVYANAIRWFNARQRGVQKARAEFGCDGVAVLHAGEVVHVVQSMRDGKKNMVNQVLPYVPFDLISYSAWDATVIGGIQTPALLKEALDYIAQNAQPSGYFGDGKTFKKHIYIGEFGLPENEYSEQQIRRLLDSVVQVALEWGCPYVVYWQLYCNEPQKDVHLPNWNKQDHRGFWLIRPDGTASPAYDYLHALLQNAASENR